MKHLSIISLLFFSFVACSAPLQEDQFSFNGEYLGQPDPGDNVVLFAPGFASTQHHDDGMPAFSKDSKEVIFRINGNFGEEVVANLYHSFMDSDGNWSRPQLLQFSGNYMNGLPWFADDGSGVYVMSKRPHPDDAEKISRSRLWFVPRDGQGWLEPKLLSDFPTNDINPNGGISIAANGNIYVSFAPDENTSNNLYFYEFKDGEYQEAVLMENVNEGINMEITPYVDPEERFLLFVSYTREGGRLMVSPKGDDGSWQEPIHLSKMDEHEPKFCNLSPDGKYLFIVSHRAIEGSNPEAMWDVKEFEQPVMEQPADIFWVRSDFIFRQMAGAKTKQ